MPTLEQLYGKSLRSALPVTVAARMRPPAPEEGELPDVDPSLVSRVGSTVGGGLSAAANILDLPGSSVRDILAWENPFDQWWTPSRPDNRTTGRDLARKWGVAGKDDTWGNFAGGLAAEIALDPLTYTGIGAFTKAGTALSKAGLTKSVKTVANEAAEGMARQSGKTLGKKRLGELGARMRMTPRQVIEGSEDVLDAKSKWLQTRGKLTLDEAVDPAKIDAAWDLTKDSDELLDKPIQSIASFRVPGLMKEPLELTRDPKSTKSNLQKFVDKNAEAAPAGFQLPPGVTPAAPKPTSGSSPVLSGGGIPGDPIISAAVGSIDNAVNNFGEVWRSENFSKISPQHKSFDSQVSRLVSDGALKDTDADVLRLALSGASEDGMRIMNRPYLKAVDTLSAGEAGKAAGRWNWKVGDSGLLEFTIEIAKDRPASQSGLSVLLHELGHMAQWEYKNIPGNSWGSELSTLIGKVQDSGRLGEEFKALHGEKLGEYLSTTFEEQFPQLFADSIVRRKVPYGALGKIITDVRDWVVQFLEKLKVIKSIPKPTQKKIDSIIDELMGFDKADAAKTSAWKKVKGEAGIETYRSGGMTVTKDGDEWFASYKTDKFTNSSAIGFQSMDEAINWAETKGITGKKPAGSFTPGQEFYDKGRAAGLDHNQATLWGALQTGNTRLAKHLEGRGHRIPDDILDALSGSPPKPLFERLKYKGDTPPSGSADMVSIVPPAARKKFYDALAIGKQKVTDELKNVMDEDLAVAAADKLDLAWRGLYKIPGASTLVTLFSAPVRGGLNEQGRDIGKMTYDALEEARAGARERITPIVRAFEDSGLFDENKLVASGMTKEQAIQTLNERDSLIREYLEYDPGKAVRPMPGLTPELAALTPQIDQVRTMLDDILKLEQSAGLDANELQDKYLSYLMRYRRNPGKAARHNPSQGSVMEISHSALNTREFRDIPGGVRTIQDMSLDPVISGIVHLDPVIKGKIEKADWPKLREHVALKYGDELEDGFDITKFDPDKDTKFDSMIRSMANLDPFHIQDSMPIFGRSLVDDLARRMEDGVRVSNNAMTAQLLLGKTALPADVARNKVDDLVIKGASEADALRDAPQGVTITKILKDIGFKNSRAWDNTIDHMRPEAIAQRDGMLGTRRADVDALAAGESIILDTIDEGKVKLTREASGDFSREVQKLGSNGKPVNGQATKQIVPDDDINAFIRQEQNAEFLDMFQAEKDIHTQVTRWLKPFSNAEEFNQVMQAMNRLVNVTKSLWTAPWPAFHTRNLISGQVQNAMLGAKDPTAKGPMRFFKPIMQATKLRDGETIVGIASEVPLFKGMTDDAATRKLSDLAFKYGVTGDKMGLAAEHIGESHQALRSQMPGMNREIKPLSGAWDIMRGRFSEGAKKFSPAPAGTTGWDAANPLAVRDGIGIGKEGVIHYTDDAFIGARVGRDVSSYVEDLNRLTPFISFLKQGYTPAEAAKIVKKLQVDYTKLSAFEKKYARLGIPFYTFSRNMLPTVVEELIHNPGGPMGQTVRVLNRSRTDDAMVPEYVSNTAAIPFGTKPDGTKSYVTGLGLAFEDSLNLLEGAMRGQPEDTVKNVLARSNPLIKGTVEGVTGRSLYFDGVDGGKPLVELDPPLGRTIANIKDLATGARTEEAEPFLSSRFEFLMSNSPAARAISTARTLTDPRKIIDRPLDTFVNLATGFRLRDVSPSSQDYSYRERLAEALKDSGAREFRRTYLPDSRAEKLDEEEMALVDRMLSELKVLDKRQKTRREQAEVAEQATPNGKINSALFTK